MENTYTQNGSDWLKAQDAREDLKKYERVRLGHLRYTAGKFSDGNHEVVTYEGAGNPGDLIVHTWTRDGKPYLMSFGGKRKDPDTYGYYNSVESRTAKIEEAVNARRQWAESKAADRQERQNYEHNLKVGDVFVDSWGYEQTNVDFYQVTEIVGKKTVKIRRIGAKIVEDSTYSHGMADNVVPVPNAFLENCEEETKRVKKGNWIRTSSFSLGRLWDGQPRYRSWYY